MISHPFQQSFGFLWSSSRTDQQIHDNLSRSGTSIWTILPESSKDHGVKGLQQDHVSAFLCWNKPQGLSSFDHIPDIHHSQSGGCDRVVLVNG
jgi:hypothetical protein